MAVLIVVCSIFGLPWFVAATVLSINHVKSLTVESESAAPGEKPQFLGIREQRVTHITIFFTIGISVFFGPFLALIPMPGKQEALAFVSGLFLRSPFSSRNHLDDGIWLLSSRILILLSFYY